MTACEDECHKHNVSTFLGEKKHSATALYAENQSTAKCYKCVCDAVYISSLELQALTTDINCIHGEHKNLFSTITLLFLGIF